MHLIIFFQQEWVNSIWLWVSFFLFSTSVYSHERKGIVGCVLFGIFLKAGDNFANTISPCLGPCLCFYPVSWRLCQLF